MALKIELNPATEREFEKIDRQTPRRIVTFLHGRVAALDNPRSIGEALKGSKLGEFRKYRVGDTGGLLRASKTVLYASLFSESTTAAKFIGAITK